MLSPLWNAVVYGVSNRQVRNYMAQQGVPRAVAFLVFAPLALPIQLLVNLYRSFRSSFPSPFSTQFALVWHSISSQCQAS